jgi:hypothetical protein
MHIRPQLDTVMQRNSLKPAANAPLGERLRKMTLLGLAAVFLTSATTQLAAFDSGTPDPRVGVWTLVSAESTLDPPNQLTITPVHGGAVHVAMTGETRFDFTAKPDGHETAVPGNPAFNQIELHRIDKRLTEVKEEKDGALVATVRNQLSKDGKELTTTTVKAGHPDQVTVWTRTGARRPARRRVDPGSG